METSGQHIIAELDGCDPEKLSDPACIRRMLVGAVQAAGATRLSDRVFEFGNGGVSGFVLLAESHISIHTWPEHAYAAIDIYTCGRHTRPELACHHVAEHLGASRIKMSTIDRGRLSQGGVHEHAQVGSSVRQGVDIARAPAGQGARADAGHEHHPVGSRQRPAVSRGL
jgi:S-adenosylmethionine decarboxylase